MHTEGKYQLLGTRRVWQSGSWMYDAENPELVLCDNLEGWGGEGGGRGVQEEGTHVCLWLIHVDVRQKNHNIVK